MFASIVYLLSHHQVDESSSTSLSACSDAAIPRIMRKEEIIMRRLCMTAELQAELSDELDDASSQLQPAHMQCCHNPKGDEWT